MSNTEDKELLQSDQPHYGKWHVYRWMIGFLRPYGLQMGLLVLCGLIATGSELIIPKLIQRFIDEVFPALDYGRFGWLIAIAAAVCIVLIGATLLQNLLQRMVSEKAARDLQFDVFQHLRKLGISYYERHPVGESLSLLNTEVTAVQDIYRMYLPMMIQNTLFVIVALTLLTSIHAMMALILLPCFFLYYIVGPMIEKSSSAAWKKVAQNRVLVNKQMYDSISALPEFRAYGRQQWDFDRILTKLDRLQKSRIHGMWFSYLKNMFRRLFNYGGAIVMFIYGAYLIHHNQLTIGSFIAFSLLYFTTMLKINDVIYNLTQQQMLISQGELLYAFMHKKPEVEEPLHPVRLSQVNGALSLRDVSFGYDGGPLILKGLLLEIEPGEKIALVGTSGGGKSTLLKLVTRFYDPIEGDVLLDGVKLRELAFDQIRDAIGYVFQETYLFGSSVYDNILFGCPDASETDVIEAAKAAYAHDFITQLPEGYETLVGERGVKLSGGQRQRISLARLFLKNPRIIVLDEATSALDNVSEREVQAALDNLMKGRTTITVAHRLSTVRSADRIVVIDGGCVAESGSYEELMERRELFFRLSEGDTDRKEERIDEVS